MLKELHGKKNDSRWKQNDKMKPIKNYVERTSWKKK
jgi:hypothetical protein